MSLCVLVVVVFFRRFITLEPQKVSGIEQRRLATPQGLNNHFLKEVPPFPSLAIPLPSIAASPPWAPHLLSPNTSPRSFSSPSPPGPSNALPFSGRCQSKPSSVPPTARMTLFPFTAPALVPSPHPLGRPSPPGQTPLPPLAGLHPQRGAGMDPGPPAHHIPIHPWTPPGVQAAPAARRPRGPPAPGPRAAHTEVVPGRISRAPALAHSVATTTGRAPGVGDGRDQIPQKRGGSCAVAARGPEAVGVFWGP